MFCFVSLFFNNLSLSFLTVCNAPFIISTSLALRMLQIIIIINSALAKPGHLYSAMFAGLIVFVCLSVSLFLYGEDISRTAGWTRMKLSGMFDLLTGTS